MASKSYNLDGMGEVFFFPISGRTADEYDVVCKEELPLFKQQVKLLIIIARNQDRTPRFTDADFDRLYDIDARNIAEAMIYGQKIAGIVDDPEDHKKK